jgi:putative tryptophan/tyrosine transport system substrate-binding protein
MRVFTVAAGIPRMCAHSSSTTTASAWGPWTAAFVQRLRELGWIEGRTVTIEYRWAEARSEHFAEIAAEFVRLKVDVIVTGGNAAAAAKQASSVVPIVFVLVGDPLGTGLVASLARPGGNVTGLSNQATDVVGKRLELLREVLPSLRWLAIMANVDYPTGVMEMGEIQAAAGTLGLDVTNFEIRRAIAPAFETLKGRADALYVVGDALVTSYQIRINTLALAARLPTIYSQREQVEAGGRCPTDQTSRTCSDAPPTMSTRFCAGQSQPTSRSSSRPSLISPST